MPIASDVEFGEGVHISHPDPVNLGRLWRHHLNESDLIAHVHVIWLAPVKIRKSLIGGDLKMIVHDDLEPSEKIKVYDKGVTVTDDPDGIYALRVGYRAGDMWAPQLSNDEALRVEVTHFIQCVETGQASITDGHAGLRLVRILEAADRSLAQQGTPVELASG